ncbi:MAG: DUF1648 domain-containing protein [Nanoarchaeota archaeon]|nr:DUF1648 domain-containing protein [Nanoarchaeota archaeon]
MKKQIMVLIALIIASIGLLAYSWLPDTMATHWGIDGKPDGYMPKLQALLFAPFMLLFLLFLLDFAGRDQPQIIRKNMDIISWMMSAFLAYIHCLMIAYSLPEIFSRFDFTQAFLPAMGILFIGIGYLSRGVPINPVMGVRLPWIMKSEHAWRKVNTLFGNMMIGLGVLSFASIAIPGAGLMLFIPALLLLVLITFIYSFVVDKK